LDYELCVYGIKSSREAAPYNFAERTFKVHAKLLYMLAQHMPFNFPPESAGANEFAHLQPATSRTAARAFA
jgi:hypothetical protein